MFTLPGGGKTVGIARFTKDMNYLVVGMNDGTVQYHLGKGIFNATPNFTLSTQAKTIVDLDVNANNITVVCYSNSATFYVIWNHNTTGSTIVGGSITSTKWAVGCRISSTNVVVIIDNTNRAYTYTLGVGTINAAFVSTVLSSSQPFSGLDVRKTGASPIKVILSGGQTNSRTGGYFLDSTGTIT